MGIIMQEGICLRELVLGEGLRYASSMSGTIIARNVVALRRHLGLNQTAFAERVGTQQANVSKWESRGVSPEGVNLATLAELAGVSGRDFISKPWKYVPVDSDGAPKPWAPREDTIKLVLESGLLPLTASHVPADDLQLLAHAVTKGLQLVAAQPSMEDDPGFRKAVETTIANAIADYRPPHGKSA